MASHPEVDLEQLQDALRALGHLGRLELLQQLRYPRALADLSIMARHSPGEEAEARPMSRNAVEEHLRRLVEVGVVRSRDRQGGRARREYVVDPAQLYRVVEALRAMASMPATMPPDAQATVSLEPRDLPPRADGPHLLLVHGMHEGTLFPLDRTALGDDGRGWVLGRKRGLHVPLAYDPFVSLENSEILPVGNRYELLDLRSSRNGTWLNFRRLERGGRATLREGDVVGAGCSSLVFRLG